VLTDVAPALLSLKGLCNEGSDEAELKGENACLLSWTQLLGKVLGRIL
jgi:hypothetical protein